MIAREHFAKFGTELWEGYYRPIDYWNKGKQMEHHDRLRFNITDITKDGLSLNDDINQDNQEKNPQNKEQEVLTT